DLVIEAVFEDLEVKRDLFRRLDAICPAATILATNTSSFRVRDLAAVVRRRSRVLGLHFFYHPAKNRLVEVVGARPTSPAVLDSAWRFAERVGKTPIASADSPGFVVNRFFVPWLNEAVRLLEESVCDVATIDAAAKDAFGIALGPFALMNATGVPVALHAATALGEELGPFYRPAARLADQVAAGRPWDLAGTPDGGAFEAAVRRLSGAALLAASEVVDEGVAGIEEADIGARVGLRWAQGPFEMANRLGLDEATCRARELAEVHGRTVPRVLAGRGGRPFRFVRVRLEARGGVATITVRRPDALNALDEEVVEQIEEAWDEVERDRTLRAVVLAGSGKAFVAGADVRFFVRCMDRGDLGRIRAFTERAARLYRRIEEGPIPVTVRLDGPSLGGGSELVLCADRVLATPRGSMAFPETGLGIYPGLGGTQRLARRIGAPLAKYFILTGAPLDAATASALGLAQPVEPEGLDQALAEAPPLFSYPVEPPGPPATLARAAAFFAEHSVDECLSGRISSGGDPEVERWLRWLGKKVPGALRLAERIIDEGVRLPLDQGLALELAHLEDVFRTPEARAGLASLG
ncbi:MAG: enoyl-CoA hydratase/isomerase family protein, partial [Planctomycetes bacterium]|nr:enoyl-CoA hydratase/isomerase family protein [Planctomycetota bacterium]